MNQQVNMANFIAPKSDQLNADDLIAGPMTVTITAVSANEGSPEQPISISFQGDEGKPYKPCKSMRRVMVHIWGADASKYVGRSMTLYRDPKVQFGGMQVGGIRISHMTHIDEKKTMSLTATRAKRAPFTVMPLENPAGSASAPPQTDDPAERWVNTYIGKLQGFSTLDEIAALENAQAARLADLKGKRPELHERIAAAAEARRGQLSGSDLDAGFEEPAAAQPSDTTDADQKVDDAIARAKAATTSEELEAIIAECEPHKAFLTDKLAMKLEIMFDQERQRFAKAEEAVV